MDKEEIKKFIAQHTLEQGEPTGLEFKPCQQNTEIQTYKFGIEYGPVRDFIPTKKKLDIFIEFGESTYLADDILTNDFLLLLEGIIIREIENKSELVRCVTAPYTGVSLPRIDL